MVFGCRGFSCMQDVNLGLSTTRSMDNSSCFRGTVFWNDGLVEQHFLAISVFHFDFTVSVKGENRIVWLDWFLNSTWKSYHWRKRREGTVLRDLRGPRSLQRNHDFLPAKIQMQIRKQSCNGFFVLLNPLLHAAILLKDEIHRNWHSEKVQCF